MTRNFDPITLAEVGLGVSTGRAGGARRDWQVDVAFCVSRGSNRGEIASSLTWEAQKHAEHDCQAPWKRVASFQPRVTWGMSDEDVYKRDAKVLKALDAKFRPVAR